MHFAIVYACTVKAVGDAARCQQTDAGCHRERRKDIYKSHRQELNDSSLNENLFKELNEELSQIQKGAINIINQYVETFFDTLSEYGLQVEDFSNGKSGVCGYFLKLRNGVYQEEELLKTRVVSAMEDSSKWAKKADWKPRKPIYEAVNNTLHQLHYRISTTNIVA